MTATIKSKPKPHQSPRTDKRAVDAAGKLRRSSGSRYTGRNLEYMARKYGGA